MKRKILLIGAGGHCKVVLDIICETDYYRVAGIVDLKERLGGDIFGIPIIGTDADMHHFFKSGIKRCFISVGSVCDSSVRVRLYNHVKKLGFVLPNLISRSACVSSLTVLGEGNFVAPGVIINAGTHIGNNCIINTGAIIEHDCIVGDFVHISPGSILNGGVKVGNCSHIGAGSTIIQNAEIGNRTIIGAGSVVTKNMPGDVIAYGNPCRKKKLNV